MATRLDRSGTVRSFERTPQGGLKVPAYLTRTGVFVYHRDGKVIREFRPADEVFKADSLASLAAAPVTIGHPGRVTPENWKNVSVGSVSDNPRADDIFVAADVRIQDAATIQGVEDGKLIEFSCGYDCKEDHTPGTFDGQPYDLVQRNIIYNHVAILPRNAGRAGSNVRIRLDEAEGQLAKEYSDTMTLEEALAKNDCLEKENATLRAENEKHKGRADAADSHLTKLAEETARADSEAAGKADLQTKLDASNAIVSRIDSIVAEKIELREGASRLLTSPKFDGKSDREIMLEAILAANPNFKSDGKSDEYILGCFTATVASVTEADVARARLKADALKAADAETPVSKKDAADGTGDFLEQKRQAALAHWSK